MPHPDLYDLACEAGGTALIPAEPCIEARIGRMTVWAVLSHRLLHADAAGQVARGTEEIAEDLGVPRRTVRGADAVLLKSGLMEPAGTSGRVKTYWMIPNLLHSRRCPPEPG